MGSDPRDGEGEFGKLFRDLKDCKNKHRCLDLKIRKYYFEPNPQTTTLWTREGIFINGIDQKLVFVCESPGPSGKKIYSKDDKRCWRWSNNDKKFRKVLKDYGFQNCFITNTVKCGDRGKISRHSDKEIGKCIKFLVRELEFIKPMIVVGVGGNAMHTIKKWVLPKLSFFPLPFQITHYSARLNLEDAWNKEFPTLKGFLERLEL